MAKILLKFRENILSETPIGSGHITAGRDSGNDIEIQNPAVSGIHARIWQEDGRVFIEDAGSTNGTYVNGEKLSAIKEITSSDEVTIGKHTLCVNMEGEEAADDEAPLKPVIASLDKTMVLDSNIKREFASKTEKETTGEFTVIEGPADASSYQLTDRVNTIGKSSDSLIRIKGFFAPKIAALVNKTDKGFTISPAETKIKVKVNGSEISGHHLLENKDVVEVAGLTLQFYLK